jgi:1,2-diacylglycerol 3-beta-glucosyltransferase
VILAIIAVSAYAAIGLAAAFMVARRRSSLRPEKPASEPVSVIVAARNEEDSLPQCLDSLASQQYSGAIEFVIVDDESDDETRQIIEDRHAVDARFRYADTGSVSSLTPGKARAVHAGIAVASHDLLLVTDADCRPPSTWVSEMARLFADSTLGVAGGVTRVRAPGLLATLQAADWSLLLAVASGWSLAGRPLTAMGNNMAFRREAYDAVGGYPGLRPSVTEDYALFQAIGNHPDWTARLDPHPSLENETEPVESFRAMFAQRRRWARGALSASPMAVAFYVIVLAAHALPLFILPTAAMAALTMMGVKVAVDAVVLAANGSFTIRNVLGFVPYQVWLYSYVLMLPVSLAVVPDIRWKGRDFRSHPSGGSAT